MSEIKYNSKTLGKIIYQDDSYELSCNARSLFELLLLPDSAEVEVNDMIMSYRQFKKYILRRVRKFHLENYLSN